MSIYQLSLPIANIEYRISSLYAFSVLSPDLHFLQRQRYSGISTISKPYDIFLATQNFPGAAFVNEELVLPQRQDNNWTFCKDFFDFPVFLVGF